LTLHQIRVFRAVAARRSFTRAAEGLGLTQSAVSAQIRELAAILGAPLFDILGRRVHLTAAGQALEAQAALLEGIVGEIGQHFAELRGGAAGRVRIGASTSIGTYALPALIAGFAAGRPGVEVTLEILNSALVEQRLLDNAFDLGFIGTPPSATELVAAPFLEDEILFACAPGHRLAGKTLAAPERLVAERLIVREPGSGTRRTMEAHLERLGILFPAVMQLGSVEAIKQAVRAGLGIAYFSGLAVAEELREHRLARIRVRGLAVRRSFLVVRDRRKLGTPALEAFLSFLRARRGRRI
jgi:DNA-binding transcriptional LysR family regulator